MNLPARAALLTAGLAAATLLGPAVATAYPAAAQPLLQSTCSYGQIDAALHATAPALAGLLDTYPQVSRELTAIFDRPVDQRGAAVDGYLALNPQLASTADRVLTGPIAGTLAAVADTCHSY